MGVFLGIDTSNYTTSVALYRAEGEGYLQCKRLLPVREGELGLRQSDAVFHHTRQLPELIEALLSDTPEPIVGVGVSEKPCEEAGSYMPCFLAGLGAARTAAAVLGAPLARFTHQQGHVAAAAFGAERPEWLDRPFLAFHVSGGTTDALLVQPAENRRISCRRLARSLDLKAGQLIDRVGGLLGLPFPAGPALERLAAGAAGPVPRACATMRGADCCLSGVENRCRRLIAEGAGPETVARFCLDSVHSAVRGMTEALRKERPELPVLYAGGVMSNGLLREALSAEFPGCGFAPAALSADNAVGIALLASRERKETP